MTRSKRTTVAGPRARDYKPLHALARSELARWLWRMLRSALSASISPGSCACASARCSGQLIVIVAVSLGLDIAPAAGRARQRDGARAAAERSGRSRFFAARRRRLGSATSRSAWALDLLLFSALLYFSGGPANPFSFLYLIHIALAAVVLPPRTSFALVAARARLLARAVLAHVPLAARSRAAPA